MMDDNNMKLHRTATQDMGSMAKPWWHSSGSIVVIAPVACHAKNDKIRKQCQHNNAGMAMNVSFDNLRPQGNDRVHFSELVEKNSFEHAISMFAMAVQNMHFSVGGWIMLHDIWAWGFQYTLCIVQSMKLLI